MSVPVPRAELDQLWSRYRATQNDQDRNAIAEAYSWVVTTVIARHYNRYSPEVREDLAQEGWIGLIRAVEHFDQSRGVAFNTYAFKAVQEAMRRYVSQQVPMVRVSVHRGVTHSLLLRVTSMFVQRYGYEPASDRELADFLGCRESLITMVRRTCAAVEVQELDWPIGDQRRSDFIADPGVADPVDLVVGSTTDSAIACMAILHQLPRLTPKQQQVVQLYLLAGMTLEQIAKVTGKSRQAVHQLLGKAINNLRLRLGVNPAAVNATEEPASIQRDVATSPDPLDGALTLKEFRRLAEDCLAKVPTGR